MVTSAVFLTPRRHIRSRGRRQLRRGLGRGLHLLARAILLMALVTTIIPVPGIYAATFDVNDPNDAGDTSPGDGICDSDEASPGPQCTLRAAIEEANALPGPDTINLAAAGPYYLTEGVLTVTSEITLNGNGETISAGGLSRIFLVEGDGVLSLDGVTLRDGVGDEGGAIHVRPGGTLYISNSAIVNNAAVNTESSSGGGINNWGGTVTIVNTTISGNRANAGGGGIANLTAYEGGSFVYGTITLTHVTITDNIADFDGSDGNSHDGGGIFTFGMLNVGSSIIAGNVDNSPALGTVYPDCVNWYYLTTQQYNLIGDNTGCDVPYPADDPTSYFPPGTPNDNHDFVGTGDAPLDPLLGDLTGNPAYHPPLAGSLAIDQIPADACSVTRDQIGTPRPQGTACDIGAVEVASQVDLSITKTVTPTLPVAPGQRVTYTLTFSNQGEGIAPEVVITDIVPVTLTHVSVISSGVTVTDTGVRPGFVWGVEDLSPGEGGIITISGRISESLIAATIFTNTAVIATSAQDSDADNNEAAVGVTVIPHESEWSDFCLLQRMEITGIGMGDRYGAINPQTISLSDPDGVNWLLVQVAGRRAFGAPIPDQVVLTPDRPPSFTLYQPHRSSPHGYTFEANLRPTNQITAFVSNVGEDYKTPRGLVLYSKRATVDRWTSVGRTANKFIYRGWKGSHTEVLTFPPLQSATDLFATAVVIDNDDDARPIVVTAEAGGVTDTVSILGSSDGPGLNIVRLALPQVPTGTRQISITVQSPTGNGDSMVLTGVDVSFSCERPTGAVVRVEPSPATIPLGATRLLTVTVDPGSAQVNGVQIHGQVDPAYLHLVDVRPSGTLTVELDPVAFDPTTGEFRYGASLLDGVITEPFPVLTLEVRAVALTDGTWVKFLDEPPPTDVSGPDGSVMSQAQDGLVIVTQAPVLRGSVDMQGRPPKPAPPWAIPLTVWLSPPGDTTPIYTATVTTNQYGEFTLALGDLPSGPYDVRLKGNHTLRNLAPAIPLEVGDNRYFFGTLLEGDVETVGTFNWVWWPDVWVMAGSFGRCRGSPGFVANADLDESGCVWLPDFGLLAGNFGKAGDIVVTPTVTSQAVLRPADGGGPWLLFNAEEVQVAVGEVVTLSLDLDPEDRPTNGVMAQLRFDPDLVEVMDVTLTDRLPLVLMEPVVDDEQGTVRFAAGVLGRTLTERFTVARLTVRVKAATTGTAIALVDLPTATDVSGPEGRIQVRWKGVTLRTEARASPEHLLYLPLVTR